jgi:hypothetical protein
MTILVGKTMSIETLLASIKKSIGTKAHEDQERMLEALDTIINSLKTNGDDSETIANILFNIQQDIGCPGGKKKDSVAHKLDAIISALQEG